MHQLWAAQPAESYKVVEREREKDRSQFESPAESTKILYVWEGLRRVFLPNHPIIENQGSINFTTQSNL